MKKFKSPSPDEWLKFELSIEGYRIRDQLHFDADLENARIKQERILRNNMIQRKIAKSKVYVGYGFGIISSVATLGIFKLAAENIPAVGIIAISGVAVTTLAIATNEHTAGQDALIDLNVSDEQALAATRID